MRKNSTKNETVYTLSNLKEELRTLLDYKEHAVSKHLAELIFKSGAWILITVWDGQYYATVPNRTEMSKLCESLDGLKLIPYVRNRIRDERRYFNMLASHVEMKKGSKHRKKLLEYLRGCDLDFEGWILDHDGRRWIKPLTGSLAEGITAGENYKKGGRWFTCLPNGDTCSYPDYWVSVGWQALCYERHGWKDLSLWFLSGNTMVNHKDGNRLNCALSNIELVHSWDNSRHARFMHEVKGCSIFNSRWITYTMHDGTKGAGHWEMVYGVSAQLIGLVFNSHDTYTTAPKVASSEVWDKYFGNELYDAKKLVWDDAEKAYWERRNDNE